MSDIFETVKTVLERDTGVPAYYELLPSGGCAEDAFIRFQRISSYELFSMSGRSNLHRDHFQITCVGRTHADLVALIALMEVSLYANRTDFVLAYPLEGSYELSEGMNSYAKDFYIWYQE